jgi:hypothetical protein
MMINKITLEFTGAHSVTTFIVIYKSKQINNQNLLLKTYLFASMDHKI